MCKLIYIFLSILGIAATSFGQNASQDELINQSRRPSVSKIISNTSNFELYSAGSDNGRPTVINKYLPEMIISLEKAFPGGTYAFLGRDMDLIADAVDAYYQSIGQEDRVKRIEFSTPSLNNSNSKLVTEFLTQLGLDSDGVTNKGAFVIIDYTSYSNTGRNNSSFPSQARYIFQGVVEQMKRNGLDENDILKRVNIATMDTNARQNIELSNALSDDRSNFLEDQVKSLKENGKIDRITYLPAGGESMAYDSEWNDKYGPIMTTDKGTLITTPMSTYSYSTKATVFLQMVKVISNVLSTEMQKRIEALAIQNGVTFQKSKVVNRPIKKEKIKKIDYDQKLKVDISQNLSNLKTLPSEKDYNKYSVANTSLKLTENGQLVVQLLTSKDAILAEHYFEISIETLIHLYNENNIGARDFRRIFAHLLSIKEIKNSGVVNMIMKNYKKVLPLEIMFGREDERNKYSSQKGIAELNYNLILQNSQLKLSCRYSYTNI